jgi:hypothetical protein
MSEIRIAPAYLTELEGAVRRLPMDTAVVLYMDFSKSGRLHSAYEDKQKRWTDHNLKLADSLTQLAQVIHAIRESFVDLDTSLAANLG